MKSLLLILTLSLSLSGCKWLPLLIRTAGQQNHHDDDGKIVLLIVGQSNGESPANGSVPPASTPIEQIMITQPGDLTLFNPGPSNPQIKNVAWIQLAEQLFLRYGQPVSIINMAAASTSTRRWNNELYQRILLAQRTYPIDAILWVQGESDYHEMISADQLRAVVCGLRLCT